MLLWRLSPTVESVLPRSSDLSIFLFCVGAGDTLTMLNLVFELVIHTSRGSWEESQD